MKKLGRIRDSERNGGIKHKIQKMMPAFKEQIFGQRENILEESLAGAALDANPLVTFINQTQNCVQEKSQQIQGKQNRGEVLSTMPKIMF
jgi:hypothetical protein